MIRTPGPCLPKTVLYQAELHSDDRRRARRPRWRSGSIAAAPFRRNVLFPRNEPSRPAVLQPAEFNRKGIARDRRKRYFPRSPQGAAGLGSGGRSLVFCGIWRLPRRFKQAHDAGASPSGKASVFGTDIPRFESWRPSQFSVSIQNSPVYGQSRRDFRRCKRVIVLLQINLIGGLTQPFGIGGLARVVALVFVTKQAGSSQQMQGRQGVFRGALKRVVSSSRLIAQGARI